MTGCYMVLDGDGDFAQTADKAQLRVTGDIALVVLDVAADVWASGIAQTLVAKYGLTGDQRSYVFRLSAAGALELFLAEDGTNATASSVAQPFSLPNDGQAVEGLGVTWRQSDKRVQFFRMVNGGWAQEGSDHTISIAAIHSGTAPVGIGSRVAPTGNQFRGRIGRVEIYGSSDINNLTDLRADPNFSAQPPGTTPFTDDAGNDWDYQGDAFIFCPPVFDPFSIGVPQSLGCGEWVAQFTERGGSPVLFEAAVSSLSARRINDGYGAAQVTIPVSAIPAHCVGDAAKLRPWQHEINLLRDGIAEWVGPISDRVSLQRETIEVHARDLSTWWDRRTAPLNRTFGESTDLSTIFRVLAEDGLIRDPSPNISFDVLPSGVQAGRVVRAGERPIIGDLLRELARDGVDYTMSGRTLRVRGPQGGDEIGPFLTSHFAQDLRHDADGLAVGSEFVVIGGSPEGSTVPPVGIAGGVDSQVGLVTRVIQESNITTQLAATSAAQQYLQALGIPPVVVQGTLLQEAPVSFGDLLPGNVARLEVEVGGTHISERMWLVGVEVRIERGDEQIRVTFGRGEATP